MTPPPTPCRGAGSPVCRPGKDVPGDDGEHRAVHRRPFRADRPRDRGPSARRGALPGRVPVPSDDVDGRIGERVGLLLHEEDLEPESLLAEHPSLASSIRAVAVAADPGQRSPRRGVDRGHGLHRRCGRGRCVADDRCDGARLGRALRRPRLGDAADLDTVVVPYAPVGPVRERLDLLAHTARCRGRRARDRPPRWDGRAWPYASRGFFPFRERIPGWCGGVVDAVRRAAWPALSRPGASGRVRPQARMTGRTVQDDREQPAEFAPGAQSSRCHRPRAERDARRTLPRQIGCAAAEPAQPRSRSRSRTRARDQCIDPQPTPPARRMMPRIQSGTLVPCSRSASR